MNYNKNSRKMTARNIVMLIGVVLGIQAGFASHAMEENNKPQFQQNSNESYKEQASKFAEKVNAFVTDTNRIGKSGKLFYDENKIEEMTLADLKDIFWRIKNNLFKPEEFFNDKIYVCFECDFVNFYYRCVSFMEQGLDWLAKLELSFSDKTIKQISDMVQQGQVDEQYQKILCDLTTLVSNCHGIFKKCFVIVNGQPVVKGKLDEKIIELNNLIKYIQDRYSKISEEKEGIFKIQKESTQALQNVFNTKPLLEVAGGNDFVNNAKTHLNNGDLWSLFKFIFDLISKYGFCRNSDSDINILKAMEENLKSYSNASELQILISNEILFRLEYGFFNALCDFLEDSSNYDETKIYGQNTEYLVNIFLDKLKEHAGEVISYSGDQDQLKEKLNKTFDNLAKAFKDMLKTKKTVNTKNINEEQKFYNDYCNDYCSVCLLGMNFLIFVRYLSFDLKEQFYNEKFKEVVDYFKKNENNFKELSKFDDIENFCYAYEDIMSTTALCYEEIGKLFSEIKNCFISIGENQEPEGLRKVLLGYDNLLTQPRDVKNEVKLRDDFTKYYNKILYNNAVPGKLYKKFRPSFLYYFEEKENKNDFYAEVKAAEEINSTNLETFFKSFVTDLNKFNDPQKPFYPENEIDWLDLFGLKTILTKIANQPVGKGDFLNDEISKKFQNLVKGSEFKNNAAIALKLASILENKLKSNRMVNGKGTLKQIFEGRETLKQIRDKVVLYSIGGGLEDVGKDLIDLTRAVSKLHDIIKESGLLDIAVKGQAAFLSKTVKSLFKYLKKTKKLGNSFYSVNEIDSLTFKDLIDFFSNLNASLDEEYVEKDFSSENISRIFKNNVLENDKFNSTLYKILAKMENMIYLGVGVINEKTTLKDISIKASNGEFDRQTLEKLADLTKAVSELHEIFKQTGILDEVDKFKLQINEINEIKEENEGYGFDLKNTDENINKINFIAGENQNKNQYKNKIIIDKGQNNGTINRNEINKLRNDGLRTITEEGTEKKQERAAELIEEITTLFKDLNKTTTSGKYFYDETEIGSMNLSNLKDVLEKLSTTLSLKDAEFLNDDIKKSFIDDVVKGSKFNTTLSHVLKQLTEFVPFFSKKETLQQISEDVKKSNFDGKTVEKLANLTKEISELHDIFRNSGILAKVNEFNSQINEITYLVGVVNGLLKDFNLLMKEKDFVKLESFTLDDLNITLGAFKSKLFSKEVFLSGEIYDEFGKKVLDNESFKVALDNALKTLGFIETIFSKEETLQKISEELRNKDFVKKYPESIAWLSDLTYYVSELHNIFTKTGILEKVNKFNLQKNEIKEAKNEIKEDENKIDEGYKNDEAENKKIKLINIDNKFIEWKGYFDGFLKTVGFDEYLKNKDINFVLGEDNYPTVLSYVKQICYLIWKNVNIENGVEEKNLENPFENCSSLSDVLVNFVNKLIESAEPYLGTLSKSQNKGELKTSNLSSKLQWILSIAQFCKNKQAGRSLSTNEQTIKVFKKIFDSWQKFIKPELNKKTK